MSGTEDLAHAIDRLSAAGYRDAFRAEPDGLRAVRTGCIHQPEALIIDEVVRFEGVSDPDDEAILFALRCEVHGAKGTYAMAYGPDMGPLDVEMVQRLHARTS